MVLSGGNDGKVVLQRWDNKLELASQYRSRPDEGPKEAKEVTLPHGRKINYIATDERSPVNVYVADVSKRISVYSLR